MTILDLYRQIMADDWDRCLRHHRELLALWDSEDAEPEPCVIVDAGDATEQDCPACRPNGWNFTDGGLFACDRCGGRGRIG